MKRPGYVFLTVSSNVAMQASWFIITNWIQRANKRGRREELDRYVECAVGGVYRIPLSCGREYIGHTGRCVNERADEHALLLRSFSGGHLPVHCVTCLCVPKSKSIAVLGRAADRTARELLEAYEIGKAGSRCISQTSYYLHKKEIAFLSTC